MNVRYHVSFVMCHVSGVICHMLGVKCYRSHFVFLSFLDKEEDLVGGGSIISMAYPVLFGQNFAHFLLLYIWVQGHISYAFFWDTPLYWLVGVKNQPKATVKLVIIKFKLILISLIFTNLLCSHRLTNKSFITVICLG